MNVKLLRKIQKHILAEPKRYDQTTWGEKVYDDDENAPPCGTRCCIAGWAYVLGDGIDVNETSHTDFLINSKSRGASNLELNDSQANRLFALPTDGEWPEKYERQYEEAKTPRGRVRAAVRRIDHFIKTKGAE